MGPQTRIDFVQSPRDDGDGRSSALSLSRGGTGRYPVGEMDENVQEENEEALRAEGRPCDHGKDARYALERHIEIVRQEIQSACRRLVLPPFASKSLCRDGLRSWERRERMYVELIEKSCVCDSKCPCYLQQRARD